MVNVKKSTAHKGQTQGSFYLEKKTTFVSLFLRINLFGAQKKL